MIDKAAALEKKYPDGITLRNVVAVIGSSFKIGIPNRKDASIWDFRLTYLHEQKKRFIHFFYKKLCTKQNST